MKKRKWLMGCLGCLGLIFVVVFFFIVVFALSGLKGAGIAVLPIEGILLSGESESTISMEVVGAQTVTKLIRKAQEDNFMRALVVWVDSPGGSAAASQEICYALRRFKKKTGKTLVVSMGDIAASGGYYVSVASDRIFALPSTLTGSIGVIWQSVNLEKLMANWGIKSETVKSGRFKDIGSPFRTMSRQERQLIQKILNDTYEQFIADVAKGRKLSIQKVRSVADGHILTGRLAKQVGLVDELGTLDDAIRYARLQENLSEKAPVWFLKERKSLLDQILGIKALSPFPTRLVNEPLLLHIDGRFGLGLSSVLQQGIMR